MVELAIWYDQRPTNDYGPGDPPYVVATPAELDELIDRVLADTERHQCPAMVQVGLSGGGSLPGLEVGLSNDKGFIHYHAFDGGGTKGDGDPGERVEYDYMGNVNEIPADSEVPIADVRRGLHEFLATGSRPSVVVD